MENVRYILGPLPGVPPQDHRLVLGITAVAPTFVGLDPAPALRIGTRISPRLFDWPDAIREIEQMMRSVTPLD